MKNLILGILLLCAINPLMGDFVTIYYDLNDAQRAARLKDNNDDTAALKDAIKKAGEGGGVLIPFGNCIVSSPVQINKNVFTFLGEGDYSSHILLRNNGSIVFSAPGNGTNSATYAIEDIRFIRNSGNATNVSVDFPSGKNATLKISDVEFFGNKNNNYILSTNNVDHLNLLNVDFKGGGMGSGNSGIEVKGGRTSASFVKCNFSKLNIGLNIKNSYQFVRIVESKFSSCSDGIKAVNATAAPMEWIVLNSFFEGTDKRYINIASPVSLSISDCVFDKHTKGSDADVLLNNTKINGIVATNSFNRGLDAVNIGTLGVVGNVFKNGFTRGSNTAHVITGNKQLIQMEGNLFTNRSIHTLKNLNGRGKVYRDVRVIPGGHVDRPLRFFDFNDESHRRDDSIILKKNDLVLNVKNGSWVKFDNLNLSNARSISIKGSARHNGTMVEVRKGSPTGILIATVPIKAQDSHFNHINFKNKQKTTADLYFVIKGGNLNDLNTFILNSGLR